MTIEYQPSEQMKNGILIVIASNSKWLRFSIRESIFIYKSK